MGTEQPGVHEKGNQAINSQIVYSRKLCYKRALSENNVPENRLKQHAPKFPFQNCNNAQILAK